MSSRAARLRRRSARVLCCCLTRGSYTVPTSTPPTRVSRWHECGQRTACGVCGTDRHALVILSTCAFVLLLNALPPSLTRSCAGKIGLINVFCRPDCLPASGPRANYEGLLGLPVMRAGRLVPLKATTHTVNEGRSWGDTSEGNKARL